MATETESRADPVTPTILWLRRDLRLADHPGWTRALEGGGPVIPVFVLDPVLEESLGAAAAWRLNESLRAHAADLAANGSRLTLRRGEALSTLRTLAQETGAKRIVWSRLHDPASIARDKQIKAALAADGLETVSVNAALLFEPWTVETGQGGYYRVYTPYWRAVRDRDVGTPLKTPGKLAPPDTWPTTDTLEDWRLGAAMNRGAAVLARHAVTGEAAARHRLDEFIDARVARYKDDRDRLDLPATSGLSENLTYGEISPRQLWHAGLHALEAGAQQAEHFLKELAWREFGWHLLYHCPDMQTANWRSDWDAFPWRPDNPDAERWRRGLTGIDVIDAAMRQLYVTGTMHNRARMIVASFLTKHLLTHWRVGAEWFRDCLIDWDPASNAMGWQWVAGSGPDAAPYFRVFNPETQAQKFDPEGRYVARYLAEGRAAPHPDATAFFDAAPRRWNMAPTDPRPAQVISLAEGRARTLEAYAAR